MADTLSEAERTAAEGEFEYRSFEPWALMALVLALLSPLAMIDLLLLTIPILGFAASVIALVRLSHDTARPGRGLALIALAFSTAFLAAPIVQKMTTHAFLAAQGREVADQFFADLRDGHPERALMLKGTPDVRAGHGKDLWLVYRSDGSAQNDLLKFVGRPVVRTLLELGPRAHAEYYRTTGSGSDGSRGMVNYWYTVTFDDDAGKKKTFLMAIMLERKPTKSPDLNPWRVLDFTEPFNPNP